MATPNTFIRMRAAAIALMADVNTASAITVTQAPSHYGTDFRITPGQAMFQVQITPAKDYGNSNDNWPRAIVTVLIHHYVTTNVNETLFLDDLLGHAADILMVHSTWRAESYIYDLQPDVDPEMEDGGRVGNVITFEISAAVLADPV